MILAKFQRLLKRINPKLRLRHAGHGDVVGLFSGRYGRQGYILRLSKGELALQGHRQRVIDMTNPSGYRGGLIAKRGRKTIINLLRNYRWLNNHRQATMLTFGIEYEDLGKRMHTGGTSHG